MGRSKKLETELDVELGDLPAPMRWRAWMGRVEAVIFASAEAVPIEVLQKLVGRKCDFDRLIADIQTELAARPYELVFVAGGYAMRTREMFGPAIRTAFGARELPSDLSKREFLVLMAIAYQQPVTRSKLSEDLGWEISRNTIAALRDEGLIGAGPRSPKMGAPYTYVTTKSFLERFGFGSLRDLPDLQALIDAGLIDAPAHDGLLVPVEKEDDDEETEGASEDSTDEELDQSDRASFLKRAG